MKKQTKAKGVVTKAFTDRLARGERPSDDPNAGAAGAGLPGSAEKLFKFRPAGLARPGLLGLRIVPALGCP